jgi:hypothetical protein
MFAIDCLGSRSLIDLLWESASRVVRLNASLGYKKIYMLIKKKVIFINIGVVVILFVTFCYQLFWGKLFPYSPIKIGFNKYELSNIIVDVQNGCMYDQYKTFDSYISEVKKFHELQFINKPKIFIFRDADNYLQHSITKARFFAYPNGSLVISPWAIQEARDGKISLKIYLKHEFSHTLLFQHMGFITAYLIYPRWLLEGIAVYSTEQMGTSWYPSKAETYKYINRGNFFTPEYFNASKENEVKLDVKYKITFEYSEFACIVDYLIAHYGKIKFIQYIVRLLNSYYPDDVFKEIYGIDFKTCLQDFKNHVNKHI